MRKDTACEWEQCIVIIIVIKSVSSDEQALAGRTRRAVVPPDFSLTCYLHVMMGRKQAVNIMSIGYLADFLCPVSGAMDMPQFWCTDIFRATPSTFLRDLEELYVEVTRTWCFTAKDWNWPHHGQQVWRRGKLLTGFHLQGLKMILSDCEVCCVKSVGGGRYSTRIGNISIWRPKSKWPT